MKKQSITIKQLFEKILVEHVATSELRDIYRKQFKTAIKKHNEKHQLKGFNEGGHYANSVAFDEKNYHNEK
jgi:cation transport regulator ChaB